MNKPLITIAIPTYNRADKYLRRTLECATRQTYSNIEILVSDNCSTDNTAEVVRSFSDPRIVFYQQEENLGAYGNWNYLLEEAQGDYFLMYHDDDQIDTDFIESCLRKADYRNNYSLIMSGSRVIDQNNNILRENYNRMSGCSVGEFILGWYSGQVNVFFCSSLFNTKLLRSIGGFEPYYDHYIDVAAQFKCIAAGDRIDIPEVKASFRKHKGSITSRSSIQIESWIEDAKKLLKLTTKLAPENGNELKKVGLKKSAMNMYMYANEIISKKERAKAFLKIYKEFGCRYLPQMKYANQLIPFLGYAFHPYRAMSRFKWEILNKYKYKRDLAKKKGA